MLATICPVRFLEAFRLFKDAAKLAFGDGATFVAAPEVRILKVNGAKAKRIGKVDFILSRVDDAGNVTPDFAALEVQAVYFSGRELRSTVRRYLQTGELDQTAMRRPDWRSSIQKRMMPQLALKVPRIRNLHRKFFVATDSVLFGNIPQVRQVPSFENSEVTWLVYPFTNSGQKFVMGEPEIKFTEWEAVLTALREGEPLSRDEIVSEVARKRRKFNLPTIRV